MFVESVKKTIQSVHERLYLGASIMTHLLIELWLGSIGKTYVGVSIHAW
jgi:hypothetical protein